ncbi:MAG TPA: ribonuclease HII [Clostridiales bacterium]|nr:ribonuclease HII [Clostridiales bacterium]
MDEKRKEPAAPKKIAEVKLEFMQAKDEDIPSLLTKYKEDERSGVITICNQYRNKIWTLQKEMERLAEMRKYENKYSDYQYICGIDEVGRGPFSGPVVAAAVILPKDCNILYINDSKQLSEKKREELYDEIIREAVAYGVGSVPPNQIDEMNILQATYEAMRKAIGNLSVKPDILLNDAVTIPGVDIKQVPIIKGDAQSISIAAASILAKVTRDRMMIAYDRVFPGYDFASNKGYGSAKHIEALKKLGPTPIHRMSFITNFI